MEEDRKGSSRAKHAPIMDITDLNKIRTEDTKPVTEVPVAEGYEDNIPVEEKTVVRRYSSDGRFERLLPTSLGGISAGMLPPITKKKIAIYEVIVDVDSEGNPLPDPLTGLPPDTRPPLVLPGTIVIRDFFESDPLKRMKVLKYITRSERVFENGREFMKEFVDDIVFSNGTLAVPVEANYLLYCILELHPLNASNKYRNTYGDAPAFRRTDMDRKHWSKSMAAMDLAWEAEKAVVELRKSEDIIAMASALNIPTANRMTDGDTGIKYDLRVFARNNPLDFFKVVKNTAAAVKMQVMDAIQLGLIEYSIDQRAWFFVTDGERIGTILAGAEDPQEALMKMFLKDDYQDKYKKLVDQLNYWD
jgi:hypothetical protein